VPLYTAFDSKIKQKVLRFIYGNYVPMSERGLSRVLGVSHASVNRIMREFCELDLVYSKRVGGALTWSVNSRGLAYNELSKYSKAVNAMALPIDHLLATVRGALSKCRVNKVVLFGSVAQGSERAGSDIDLFVLAPNDAAKAQLNAPLELLGAKCLELYGNPLAPYVLTEREFKHPSNPALLENISRGITILPR